MLNYCSRPTNSQCEQLHPAKEQKGGRKNRRDELATRDSEPFKERLFCNRERKQEEGEHATAARWDKLWRCEL